MSSLNKQEKKINNNMIDYISILCVISAISVVVLHSNKAFWRFSTEKYWVSANVIECVFYFAVPVFFMISGVTLIDYRDRYDTKIFFRKRIKKTLIPFLIWSIISLLYQIFISKNIEFDTLNLKTIYNGMMETSYLSIYWFFPVLFSVYLCIPVFSAIEKNKRNEVFLYIFLSAFILNNLLPFINSVFNLGFSLPITVTVGSGYLLYVVLGYLLHNNEINKKLEFIIYILGIIGLFIHIVGTYIYSINSLEIVHTFKGYNNLPCILYSVAVFVFVKKSSMKIKSEFFYKIINLLKDYTFSLYLVHWFIIDLITRIFKLNCLSIFYRLLMPFIVSLISIEIIYTIRKIPIIKRIFP